MCRFLIRRHAYMIMECEFDFIHLKGSLYTRSSRTQIFYINPMDGYGQGYQEEKKRNKNKAIMLKSIFTSTRTIPPILFILLSFQYRPLTLFGK